MAVLVLVAAVAGTAVAGPDPEATTSIGKKKVKKLIKKKLNKKFPVESDQIAGSAVTEPKIAGDAVTGAKVDESTLGTVPRATIGAPRAYAYITPGGTVGNPSEGIANANVTKPTTGNYCFNGLPFTPRHIQATASPFGDADNIASGVVQGSANDGDCPGVEQAHVAMVDISLFSFQDEDFYVALWD